MVIPGATILLFLQLLWANVPFPANAISVKMQELWAKENIVIAIVLSYVIGIANHLVTTKVWVNFRNDPKKLQSRLEYVKMNIPDSFYLNLLCHNSCEEKVRITSRDYLCGIWWLLVCVWFVGQLFCIFQEVLLNDKIEIVVFTIDLLLIVLLVVIMAAYPYEKNENKKLLSSYYKAYYYVQQNYKNSDISVIEGQVAFLQAMFFPIALFLCLPSKSIIDLFSPTIALNTAYFSFLIRLPFVLLWLCFLPMIVSRQNKIYELVWEDYEYLKQIKCL